MYLIDLSIYHIYNSHPVIKFTWIALYRKYKHDFVFTNKLKKANNKFTTNIAILWIYMVNANNNPIYTYIC